MNREYDNVEIINFESITNNDENDMILDNDDIAMEYLTNFLIEKFDHEENHPQENITINDNQSLMSFYSASTAIKSSDNLSTSRCYESIISEKEKIPTPYEFKPEVKNEKPFQCDYVNCKKNFKYKWILDRHLISHKTIKLFICNHMGCEKSYKSKENLTLHIKNIHLKEKPYSCSYCSSLFSHRNGIYFLILKEKHIMKENFIQIIYLINVTKKVIRINIYDRLYFNLCK